MGPELKTEGHTFTVRLMDGGQADLQGEDYYCPSRNAGCLPVHYRIEGTE